MIKLLPFLAQVNISYDDAFGGWKKMSSGTREFLTIAGAICTVTLLVFIWAIFIRKRGKRRRAGSQQKSQPRASTQAATPAAQNGAGNPVSQPQHRRHRRRRRRREHRPRNPTLADTGGLPPIRSEGPIDPIP
jgi:hypothetical protein